MRNAGIALAGTAAFGLAGCETNTSSQTTQSSNDIVWDDEYDVIIAGAGAAGLTAAITVADEGDGATCLLLEKDEKPNGNTPFCAGYQLYFDNVDEAMVYLNCLIGDSIRRT